MQQEDVDRLSKNVTQGKKKWEKNVKYQLCQNVVLQWESNTTFEWKLKLERAFKALFLLLWHHSPSNLVHLKYLSRGSYRAWAICEGRKRKVLEVNLHYSLSMIYLLFLIMCRNWSCTKIISLLSSMVFQLENIHDITKGRFWNYSI